jgi:hypothetical protein
MKLANGAKIVRISLSRGMTFDDLDGYVLAQSTITGEYITWYCVEDRDEPGTFTCHWGRYFRDYDEALSDYRKRCDVRPVEGAAG